MLQTLRVYTPEFAQELEEFLDEQTKELDQVQFEREALLTLLEAFWFRGYEFPPEVDIPMELMEPEYVEYRVNSEEAGQPLLATANCCSYHPQEASPDKLAVLHSYLEDTMLTDGDQRAKVYAGDKQPPEQIY